jgi:hypothetical protein
MAFVFIIIGLVILVSGVRGTQSTLYSLVKNDLDSGFIPWIVAILIIGAVGYVQDLRTLSRAFMALVIIALILKAYKNNPQIFKQFNSAFGITNNPGAAQTVTTTGAVGIGNL